jgi:hypothetical protein
MPDTLEHYAVQDRPSATAEPAPLTPDQLDHLDDCLRVRPQHPRDPNIVAVEKPVLAALLAAYRREQVMHLNNAYRYLYQAGELRLGPNRSDFLERAAEHLEAAGYSGLAAGVRDDYADFPDVMDALRERLNG